MIVAFRTTCTERTGLGHFRRCLTLAEAVGIDSTPIFLLHCDEAGRTLAAETSFAIELFDTADADPDTTLELVRRHGAQGLVVDDYALTADQLAALHRAVPNLLVLDDLADRRIDADAVLNANPAAAELTYDTPASCLRLFGAPYALLRREFRGLPRRTVAEHVQRVLVTLGGSNPGGRTKTVAQLVLQVLPEAQVDVVAGPLFRGDLPVDSRLVVHRSPRNMVDLMMRADLAIAAGGQTTYELAACGVPTVALCVADNQRANLAALAAVPTLLVANNDDLDRAIAELAANRTARQALASGGQRLVDGRGPVRVWRALAARWGVS